jgi:UDP-3-O-[3-hydroxymyristoyl] N-acetylglucosamine deacetylase
VYIDIDSLEVPILDGSSRPWVEMIRKAGLEVSSRERSCLVVTRPIRLSEGDKYIQIEPASHFKVSYEIDFDHPCIGKQNIDLDVNPDSYYRELAFARTFGFYEQVEDLLKKGLVRGGTLENAVVLSRTGIVSGELRDKFEFVRHKAMDLIGDISLCGFPLKGHVKAFKGGHALHTRLAGEMARNRSAIRLMKESEFQSYSKAVNE